MLLSLLSFGKLPLSDDQVLQFILEFITRRVNDIQARELLENVKLERVSHSTLCSCLANPRYSSFLLKDPSVLTFLQSEAFSVQARSMFSGPVRCQPAEQMCLTRQVKLSLQLEFA